MPYIAGEHRDAAATKPATPGELTYAVQVLLKAYLERTGVSYQTFAECLGALRGAELDLFDRKIQPYERAKRELNGDVW